MNLTFISPCGSASTIGQSASRRERRPAVTGYDPSLGTTFTPASTTFAGLPTIGFAVQTFVNGTLTDSTGKLVQSSYGGNFGHRYVGPQIDRSVSNTFHAQTKGRPRGCPFSLGDGDLRMSLGDETAMRRVRSRRRACGQPRGPKLVQAHAFRRTKASSGCPTAHECDFAVRESVGTKDACVIPRFAPIRRHFAAGWRTLDVRCCVDIENRLKFNYLLMSIFVQTSPCRSAFAYGRAGRFC